MNLVGFKDHFSGHATAYADARPRYPAELFDWLTTLTPEHEFAWDCGTGNGQAAVALAAHFKRVIATDASTQQIASAFPHERVEYRAAPAEHSGLAEHCVDLITVAQAAHWFELPAFYAEARRVAKPGAVLVLWCYGVCHITPEVDEVVQEFYAGESAPYWPPERKLIDEAYRTLPFPLAELQTPDFEMAQHWNLSHFLAYLRTWSAVQRLIKQTGRDPMPSLGNSLQKVWGEPAHVMPVRFPLHFRAGRF